MNRNLLVLATDTIFVRYIPAAYANRFVLADIYGEYGDIVSITLLRMNDVNARSFKTRDRVPPFARYEGYAAFIKFRHWRQAARALKHCKTVEIDPRRFGRHMDERVDSVRTAVISTLTSTAKYCRRFCEGAACSDLDCGDVHFAVANPREAFTHDEVKKLMLHDLWGSYLGDLAEFEIDNTLSEQERLEMLKKTTNPQAITLKEQNFRSKR